MTREQQYWEDTQEALSRIFDRCEEIDPQSGYEMLEDIQFIRGFINKCKPRTEKQESILDKIRAEIEKLQPNLRPEQMTDYDYAMVDVINDIVAIIDKYKAESEEE